MSFQTLEAVATGTAVVRVNLLPPEIEDARRAKRLRVGLGGALLVVLAAAAGGYALTVGHVSDAQAALEAEQARTADLQAQQLPYAEVPVVQNELQEVSAVKTTVSAGDVAWYRYVDQVAAGAPADLSFTSLVFGLTGTDAATADPLSVAGIGTLTVNGQTKSQGQVASWLEGLAAVNGLADPRLSSSVLDPATGVVTFTSGATVTADALNDQQ